MIHVQVLMIDDHQTILNGYKNILSHNDLGHVVDVTIATSFEQAIAIIEDGKIVFDIVILDYSLPPFPERKIFTGIDLVAPIRKRCSTAKIMLLTAHHDSITLWDINKKIKPEALMVKNDFDDIDLLKAYEIVFNNGHYLTKTVIVALKENLLSAGQLDAIDQKIIQLLASGQQIKTIAAAVNLSDETIKKRKSKIKELLNIEKGNDESIINECRKLKLI